MKLDEIYNVIENEIQEKYKTKVEFAKEMGISKQRLHHILKKIKNNSEVSFRRVGNILEFLGYELDIKKRG